MPVLPLLLSIAEASLTVKCLSFIMNYVVSAWNGQGKGPAATGGERQKGCISRRPVHMGIAAVRGVVACRLGFSAGQGGVFRLCTA